MTASAHDWGGDIYLAPGTRVVRRAIFNDEPVARNEYGIVIHCAQSEQFGGIWDCDIAFFGEAPPEAELRAKPYVLCYASMGVTILNED